VFRSESAEKKGLTVVPNAEEIPVRNTKLVVHSLVSLFDVHIVDQTDFLLVLKREEAQTIVRREGQEPFLHLPLVPLL
jgi:hypothetical protein